MSLTVHPTQLSPSLTGKWTPHISTIFLPLRPGKGAWEPHTPPVAAGEAFPATTMRPCGGARPRGPRQQSPPAAVVARATLSGETACDGASACASCSIPRGEGRREHAVVAMCLGWSSPSGARGGACAAGSHAHGGARVRRGHRPVAELANGAPSSCGGSTLLMPKKTCVTRFAFVRRRLQLASRGCEACWSI
jgi:hypothetical protein